MVNEQDERSSQDIQLTVKPEPTGEELLAILQALRTLEPSDEGYEEQSAHRSAWQDVARHQSLRARNWPAQIRSWAVSRR